MKPIQIVYSLEAQRYLCHLTPSVKTALRFLIDELQTDPWKGKPLKDEFEGFRSHRFKKYRVIYRYVEEKRRIEILFAGERIEVYRLFSEYLSNLSQ